jgi:hypothetical protein
LRSKRGADDSTRFDLRKAKFSPEKNHPVIGPTAVRSPDPAEHFNRNARFCLPPSLLDEHAGRECARFLFVGAIFSQSPGCDRTSALRG